MVNEITILTTFSSQITFTNNRFSQYREICVPIVPDKLLTTHVYNTATDSTIDLSLDHSWRLATE